MGTRGDKAIKCIHLDQTHKNDKDQTDKTKSNTPSEVGQWKLTNFKKKNLKANWGKLSVFQIYNFEISQSIMY